MKGGEKKCLRKNKADREGKYPLGATTRPGACGAGELRLGKSIFIGHMSEKVF
jgi:hypothetical protein